MGVRVSVIIPNWSGWRFLEPCFLSVREQVFTEFRIIVDDDSQDSSIALARESFSDVEIFSFERNRDFASAVNAGITASSGEFVAALIWLPEAPSRGRRFRAVFRGPEK